MADCFVTHSKFVQSQSQQVVIHNEQEEVFHYDLVYLRYSEACEDYFKAPCSLTGPWTERARKHIISSLKVNDKVLSLMDSVYNLEPNVLEKYQIVLDEGEEKLVLTGTAVEVLPYEECFDIFVELHKKTRHGTFDVIMKKLEDTFLVNDICLKFFLANCNICKKLSLQNIKPVVFNDCISIEILKAPVENFECRFILFYIDKVTSFMLLRPLIAIDEYEIAIEMLKIFTDFGPPVVIETIHVPLFNNVLTILERGGFNYDISIHASDKVIGESYYLMQQIIARTNRDKTHWSTVCRFIQFKHNNGQLAMRDPILNKVVHAEVKPFNQLFNTKHSTKKDDKSEIQSKAQNKKNKTGSVTNTSSNLENTVKECVVCSESSDTETASESEEYLSMHDRQIEEKIYLGEEQIQNVFNVSANYAVPIDEQLLNNASIVNNDVKNSNDIKIEFEQIEIPLKSLHMSNLESFEQTLSVQSNKDKTIVGSNTSNPLIVDSITIKEEPLLAECVIPCGSSSTTEFIPILQRDKNTEAVSQHSSSVRILGTDNKKTTVNPGDNCCSVCNAKMLTEYFCFGCKKITHIFCMSRVTTPLEKDTDTVISFTYCEICLKTKYNLTSAVKIDN